MAKAAIREENVTVKVRSDRLVNAVVKAPVINLKLTEGEALDVLNALALSENDDLDSVRAVLTASLNIPVEA